MPQIIFIAIALLLAIAIWLLLTPKRKRYIPKRLWRKQKNITTADTVLAKLHQIIQENREPLPFVLAYLRKIEPFVFEELLLTCFERQGYTIRRNKRYTGDGGVDGCVWLHGEMYLVQAKRYKDSINPVHVEEFGRVIQSRGAVGGYFVHTGRTGDKSRELLRLYPAVQVMSGQKLVDFIERAALSRRSAISLTKTIVNS
ncbi:restriction endonuclease [Halotia branconii]|uniref:Restriction endonuclease n=1 Tax=Halotia branconii CENA392 TaxID=1539056 RepID=A0AAJ6NYT7_9CYAN|nr:restriction endonuclease [Halotia branconii]WGV29090.1 restriction endonuclease [Halotia branconii CENA392]